MNLRTFDTKDDAIVKPTVTENTPTLDPPAVMLSSESDLRLLLKAAVKEPSITRPLYISQLHLIPVLKGKNRYALIGPMVGAPYAAMLLETLVAWGAEKIIFIGWCGAISEKVEIGDVILPSGAFIDEGTSLHYGGDGGGLVEASLDLTALLGAALHRGQIDFHKGAVWTTDAIYRETPAKVAHFQSKGALGVEMEASALFSVARYRQVDIGAVLVVSDKLSDKKWTPGFRNEQFHQNRKIISQQVIDLCQTI